MTPANIDNDETVYNSWILRASWREGATSSALGTRHDVTRQLLDPVARIIDDAAARAIRAAALTWRLRTVTTTRYTTSLSSIAQLLGRRVHDR